MKKILASLAFALAISFGATFDDGVQAYDKQDYKTAFKIFENLASQGYAGAQNNLGLMYENGQGVKQDYFKAKEWYENLASQGYAAAQNNLGFMYGNGQGTKQDKRVAKQWFGKACDGGQQGGCNNYRLLNEQGY